jgi:hypothetical protein
MLLGMGGKQEHRRPARFLVDVVARPSRLPGAEVRCRIAVDLELLPT